MRSPASLKQEFLKKWMVGLEACNSSKKDMSTLERKNVIKLSADVAMASARSGTTCWSRTIIANASTNDVNKTLVEQILGPSSQIIFHKVQLASQKVSNKRVRCNNLLKRSRSVMKRVGKTSHHGHNNGVAASSIAKRLVKKRTQLLKSLVPGGEFMNEVSLIQETLDYIVSLQAQVDVMQGVATASELVN